MEFINPRKIKIERIFTNSCNGQQTIIIPKRKIKGIPSKFELIYWTKDKK